MIKKGFLMKLVLFMISLILFLTACSPRIGANVGGVVISGDDIAASEVTVDSDTGIHGSLSTGSDITF